MTRDQHHDIKELAHLIWHRGGQPEGCALDHWLEAEYLVLTGAFTQAPEMPPVAPSGVIPTSAI